MYRNQKDLKITGTAKANKNGQKKILLAKIFLEYGHTLYFFEDIHLIESITINL